MHNTQGPLPCSAGDVGRPGVRRRYAEAVTVGREEDALTWSGDDDPTLDVGAAGVEGAGEASTDADSPVARGSESPLEAPADPLAEADAEATVLPEGFTAVGKGSDDLGRTEADGTVTMPGEPAALSNGMLIALGVFGGVYLLYAIGWLLGGLRLQGGAAYLVTDVMYQGSLWLAVLAPPLWFGSTFVLTRRSPAWARIVWLVAGAVLLVPWPFIMIGTVGQ